MRHVLQRFWGDDHGTTAIEYSLIAAMIGLGLIIVVPGVGDEVVTIFTDVENGFKNN